MVLWSRAADATEEKILWVRGVVPRSKQPERHQFEEPAQEWEITKDGNYDAAEVGMPDTTTSLDVE